MDDAVEDRRKGPRFGVVLADDVDTDAFRALKGADVRLYCVLLPYFREARAWPKQAALVKAAGLSQRQVSKSLLALEAAGFLAREPFEGDARRVRYVLLSPSAER